MIFARDKSQMCNNLLQFAHVYAWGREHGRKVVSMRFSYKYQYFKICHTSHTSFLLYLLAKYAAALRLLPTASFKHEECDKQALERKMLRHRNIVVAGWYVRFYDLVIKYLDEVRDLFTIDSRYTGPVDSKFKKIEWHRDDRCLRLGVHIRRGDYKIWRSGIYCYDDEVYYRHICRFREIFSNRELFVYLSTNDPNVDEQKYVEQTGIKNIYNLHNDAPGDLYMLSQCDYIIGAPSTFSVVATMYGKAMLHRIEDRDETKMVRDSFHDFNYWFRKLI